MMQKFRKKAGVAIILLSFLAVFMFLVVIGLGIVFFVITNQDSNSSNKTSSSGSSIQSQSGNDAKQIKGSNDTDKLIKDDKNTNDKPNDKLSEISGRRDNVSYPKNLTNRDFEKFLNKSFSSSNYAFGSNSNKVNIFLEVEEYPSEDFVQGRFRFYLKDNKYESSAVMYDGVMFFVSADLNDSSQSINPVQFKLDLKKDLASLDSNTKSAVNSILNSLKKVFNPSFNSLFSEMNVDLVSEDSNCKFNAKNSCLQYNFTDSVSGNLVVTLLLVKDDLRIDSLFNDEINEVFLGFEYDVNLDIKMP